MQFIMGNEDGKWGILMPCDPFGRTGAIANCVIRKEVYLTI